MYGQINKTIEFKYLVTYILITQFVIKVFFVKKLTIFLLKDPLFTWDNAAMFANTNFEQKSLQALFCKSGRNIIFSYVGEVSL